MNYKLILFKSENSIAMPGFFQQVSTHFQWLYKLRAWGSLISHYSSFESFVVRYYAKMVNVYYIFICTLYVIHNEHLLKISNSFFVYFTFTEQKKTQAGKLRCLLDTCSAYGTTHNHFTRPFDFVQSPQFQGRKNVFESRPSLLTASRLATLDIEGILGNYKG